MSEKNGRYVAEIEAVDSSLLKGLMGSLALAVRSRSERRIVLASLSGRMISLVNSRENCAPDCIKLKKLPDISIDLAEDGWKLEDNFLKIPYLIQLNLAAAPRFDSSTQFPIYDFPGHMQNALHSRLRQKDFLSFYPLESSLRVLSVSLKQHLVESIEKPILEVLGHGADEFAAGDAALCGMLLTARCFSLGGRIRITWFHRLAVEIRRFLHRASPMGKNWLSYAFDGRMTELQQHFFNAMARDYECADELVVKKIVNDEFINGKAFLTGVGMALDLIKSSLIKTQKKSPGIPAKRARR